MIPGRGRLALVAALAAAGFGTPASAQTQPGVAFPNPSTDLAPLAQSRALSDVTFSGLQRFGALPVSRPDGTEITGFATGVGRDADPRFGLGGVAIRQRVGPGLTLGATLGAGDATLGSVFAEGGDPEGGPLWHISALRAETELTSRRFLPTGGLGALGQVDLSLTSIQAEVGYAFRFDPVVLTPFAGLRHEETRQSGYTETGGAASALQVNPRRESATVAAAGLRLGVPLTSGSRLGLTAGIEGDLSRSAEPLTGRQATGPFSVPAPGVAHDVRPFAGAGVTVELRPGSSLNAEVGMAGSAYADRPTFSAGLSLGFAF